MKRRHTLVGLATTVLGMVLITPSASAQNGGPSKAEPRNAAAGDRQRDYFDFDATTSPSDRPVISLKPPTEKSDSSEAERLEMAKSLRMQRAQYQAQQRLLRHERMLWTGQVPLRPGFNSTPMMTSRYRRPVITIPVYVH